NEGIVKSGNAGGSERTDESYSAQGSAITVKKGSGGLGVLGLTDTVALSRHSDSEQVAAAYARASAAFSKMK
ncbi:hypothetical protein TNCT_611721, partial [Trichonephila clavata]